MDASQKLKIAETERHSAGEGEVLIRVAASGLNRADILQRQGKYPPPPGASPILGLEVSGTVSEAGPSVKRWKVGDQVCALLAGGGYAEYCVAHESNCLPIPASVSLVDAAALPEAVFTVWANLLHGFVLHTGQTLLVQGGSSGIGTMAIQMARALGVEVLATAGTARKCEACEELGCAAAFDYHGDWVAQCKPYGPDVILDIVGAEYFSKHLDLLSPGGTLVCIGTTRGKEATIDIGVVMRKRLHITGSTLRSRSVQEKAELAQAIESAVWPWIESGKVKPVIDCRHPAAHAQAAHELMESSGHVGKILLTWG